MILWQKKSYFIQKSYKKYVNVPVKHTEKEINRTKHQKLLVKQPVDASLPPEKELRETSKPHIGHLECVRHCHVFLYRRQVLQNNKT